MVGKGWIELNRVQRDSAVMNGPRTEQQAGSNAVVRAEGGRENAAAQKLGTRQGNQFQGCKGNGEARVLRALQV